MSTSPFSGKTYNGTGPSGGMKTSAAPAASGKNPLVGKEAPKVTYTMGGKTYHGTDVPVGGTVVDFGNKKQNESFGLSPTAKPSVINTSSLSKSNYSENVNTMTGANNNLRQVQAGQTASGIAASLGMTPEKFLELNPSFGAPGAGGTKGDYKGLDGTIQPGMTYKIAPDGTPTPVNEEPKPDKNGNITTKDENGITTTKDKDGNVTITNSRGDLIDPTIKKMLEDNITELSDSSAKAKEVMDQAAATLQDNPAAVAAANSIKAKYDTLIEQMKEKNKMLMGGIGKNAARTGMLQYANDMDSNFKSMELDKGVQRIADLLEKENEAVLKSNASYKAGDVKAFDSATKDYQSALKEKQNAIMDLNKAITDAVKLNDAELKQAKAEEKQAITDDIRVSAALGKTMAEAIATSGVTDESKIEEYVKAMAEANGINNPDILKSSLIKEQQANQTLNLKNKNTNSIINKRNSTGGKGSGKFNVSNEIKALTPLMESNKGDDKFIDPNKWVQLRVVWNEKGGSSSTFNSNFKRYLNPDSYSVAGFKG